MKKLRVLMLLFVMVPLFARPLPDALQEVVAAERNFAETCGRVGIREAFLQFFAEDVVTFASDLRRGKTHLRELPADFPHGPKLRWEPIYGDVASSGDLGYTTGPFVYTSQTGAVAHGIYFSIWKRQLDGQWKVILDAGVFTPAPDANSEREFRPAPRVEYKRGVRVDSASARENLADMERRFAETAEQMSLSRALLVHGDAELRLHRTGALPIMGARPVRDYLAQHDGSCKLEAIASDVSASGDLGFTYGRYYMSDGKERGFYIRVWKRNEQGIWRVALDTMQPVPAS